MAASILLFKRGFPRASYRFLPALCLFFISMLVSVFFAATRTDAMPERIGMYVAGVCLFLAALSFTEQERRRTLTVCLAAGAVISFLAIYQYLFGFSHLARFLKENGGSAFTLDYLKSRRVFFPFVTPNTLAAYLGMLLPLYAADRKHMALTAPVLIALLLTGSLGAIASVSCVLLVYLLIKKKAAKRKYLVLAAVFLILLAAVFIIRARADRAHVLPSFSAAARINYWEKTARVIERNPLLGVGPGNFDLPSSRYSHNFILQVWAENGIGGLAGLAWLVVLVFAVGRGRARTPQSGFLLASTAVFLLNNLVDFSFFLPEVSLIWWLVAGLAAGSATAVSPERNSSSES